MKHDIRLYFNFAFGSLLEEEGRFIYQSQKGRKYGVTNRTTVHTECHKLCGSERPIGGWISYGYGWRKPIPQLSIRTEGPVPFRSLTVIAPAGIGVSSTADMENAILRLEGSEITELHLSGDDISIK